MLQGCTQLIFFQHQTHTPKHIHISAFGALSLYIYPNKIVLNCYTLLCKMQSPKIRICLQGEKKKNSPMNSICHHLWIAESWIINTSVSCSHTHTLGEKDRGSTLLTSFRMAKLPVNKPADWWKMKAHTHRCCSAHMHEQQISKWNECKTSQ